MTHPQTSTARAQECEALADHLEAYANDQEKGARAADLLREQAQRHRDIASRTERVLAGILRPRRLAPVPDDYAEPEPPLTDSEADREYAEDADRAADRYERRLGL